MKDVLLFYDAKPLHTSFVDALNLTETERNNVNLMCYVWFAALLELPEDVTLRMLDTVRFYRSSPNPLRNGTAQRQLKNPNAARNAFSQADPAQSMASNIGNPTHPNPHSNQDGAQGPFPTLPFPKAHSKDPNAVINVSTSNYTQGDSSKKAVAVQTFFKDLLFDGSFA